jgi:TolB protein
LRLQPGHQTGGGSSSPSDRDGNSEIYVTNADGAGLRNLTNGPGNETFPAWSPNGRKVAFLRGRGSRGGADVYVMNADGTGRRMLVPNAAHDLSPAWSSDGRRTAFVGDPSGKSDIHFANADGSGQKNLTRSIARDLVTRADAIGHRRRPRDEREHPTTRASVV